MPTKRAALMCVVALFLCACASSSPRLASAEVRKWFDNSVHQPPLAARSRWTAGEHEELLRRVGLADVVAVGTISLVTDTRFHQQQRGQTVAFSPKEVLHGKLEQGSAVHLSLARAMPEMSAATQERFMIFIKRYGDDGPAFRWVLYRSSDALVDQVRAMYRWLSRKGR